MKFKYYNLLLSMLFLASCNREMEVTVPNFDVTTETTTYKVGQEILFKIKGGDAHIISFYSGTTLNDFAFRDGRIIDVSGDGATMAFQTSVQLGTQANQLSVMASTDFNGDYSSFAKVKAATWTDITSRFKLGNNATFLASGTQDISDLIVAGKPIYFAFKYLTKPQAMNGLARTWYIQSFAVTSKALLDGSIIGLTDQANAGFRIIDQEPVNAPARSTVTNTRITLLGNVYKYAESPIFDPLNPIYDPLNPIYQPGNPLYVVGSVRPTYVPFDPANPYNDPLTEHWAVSKPIDTEKVDLGPDRSSPFKGILNSSVSEYRYTYTTAGTYKAVFIVSNNSIDATQPVIKEITLTITQ